MVNDNIIMINDINLGNTNFMFMIVLTELELENVYLEKQRKKLLKNINN